MLGTCAKYPLICIDKMMSWVWVYRGKRRNWIGVESGTPWTAVPHCSSVRVSVGDETAVSKSWQIVIMKQ